MSLTSSFKKIVQDAIEGDPKSLSVLKKDIESNLLKDEERSYLLELFQNSTKTEISHSELSVFLSFLWIWLTLCKSMIQRDAETRFRKRCSLSSAETLYMIQRGAETSFRKRFSLSKDHYVSYPTQASLFCQDQDTMYFVIEPYYPETYFLALDKDINSPFCVTSEFLDPSQDIAGRWVQLGEKILMAVPLEFATKKIEFQETVEINMSFPKD